MDDATKAEIVERLADMIADLAPDAHLRAMYGGTVIELKADTPQSRIGGFYVYDGHVSLALTKGAQLDDPESFLEGTGKLRRHVKLHHVNDVTQKTCHGFLRQAILLAT